MPDAAGFCGLTASSMVTANHRADCFGDAGYLVFGKDPAPGDIVCFEPLPADEHGEHTPIVIKKETFDDGTTTTSGAARHPPHLGTLPTGMASALLDHNRISLHLPVSRHLPHVGAFPPNTLFRLRKTESAGSWLAPNGKYPRCRLLVLTATYRKPQAVSRDGGGAEGEGGKMVADPVTLQVHR